MASIMGLGNCGICRQQIADGVPVRYCGPGHTMAHKRCFEKRAAARAISVDRSSEDPT